MTVTRGLPEAYVFNPSGFCSTPFPLAACRYLQAFVEALSLVCGSPTRGMLRERFMALPGQAEQVQEVLFCCQLQVTRVHFQGAQYGLIKEYGLNYIGIHNMI